MRGELGNKARIGHILDTIVFIERSLVGKTKVDYDSDFILQAALQRWVETIGEAATRLTTALKEEYIHVEWKRIAGLRNIIVHEYFGLDLEKIWEIVETHIPPLKIKITKIYSEL